MGLFRQEEVEPHHLRWLFKKVRPVLLWAESKRRPQPIGRTERMSCTQALTARRGPSL